MGDAPEEKPEEKKKGLFGGFLDKAKSAVDPSKAMEAVKKAGQAAVEGAHKAKELAEKTAHDASELAKKSAHEAQDIAKKSASAVTDLGKKKDAEPPKSDQEKGPPKPS